ncbi:hypothetical protein FQ037_26890 [Escherichia coli]|nr:hypothetical protein [Escherichia coli]
MLRLHCAGWSRLIRFASSVQGLPCDH